MENQEDADSESPNGDQPSAAHPSPKNSTPNRDVTASGRYDKAKQPNDQFDRDLVRWTKVLAAFTGALVLTAGLQFWIMQGQLNEMQNAARPWVALIDTPKIIFQNTAVRLISEQFQLGIFYCGIALGVRAGQRSVDKHFFEYCDR